jgi:hypothetical protein
MEEKIMENNPKKIDTKYEATVFIVKDVLKFIKKNFVKFAITLCILAVPVTVFFMNGGVQALVSIFQAVFGIGKAK